MTATIFCVTGGNRDYGHGNGYIATLQASLLRGDPDLRAAKTNSIKSRVECVSMIMGTNRSANAYREWTVLPCGSTGGEDKKRPPFHVGAKIPFLVPVVGTVGQDSKARASRPGQGLAMNI